MTGTLLEPAGTTVPAGTTRSDPDAETSESSAVRRFFLRRLLFLPISLVVVVVVSFLLVALIPESTALQIAGQGASAAQVAMVRHRLGLDHSLIDQFGTYVDNLVHGNLGTSFFTDLPVASDMFNHLPATLELVIPGFVLALLLGVGSGSLAAYFSRRAPDRIVQGATTVIQSLPEFVFALLLIYLVFYKLGIAPAPVGRLGLSTTAPPDQTGFYTIDALLAGQTSTFFDALEHLALPVIALGTALSVVFSRITRATMGESLNGPHIEFARSLGLPERQIVRYALVESRTVLLTYAAITAATLVGGSAIIELIFSWQGLGEWGLMALTQLDVPQIRAYVLLTASVTLVAFVLLDLASGLLDPRITFSEEGS